MSKRLSSLAVLIGLVVVLAGCTAAPAPSAVPPTVPTQGGPQGAAPTSAPKESGASNPAAAGGTLTVYSGRTENLVGPIIERFQQTTGTEVKVRYGDTAQLAATILEEGRNSPADVFFAQDAGALGALAQEHRLTPLPTDLLDKVEPRFRSPSGEWVGVSGRARVVVYNTGELRAEALPDSIFGFTDPQWRGRLGWAPTNGSFQAFVTALRLTEGDQRAREWLEGIKANNPKSYANNTAVVKAVGDGEIMAGFVNHYYLFSFLKEQGESFPVRNYHPRAGDAGSMINVAGVSIVNTSKNVELAQRFIGFLLGQEAQQYFTDQTFEYPLVSGVQTNPLLVPLAQIKTPNIDLSNLADLDQTLRLMRDVGVL